MKHRFILMVVCLSCMTNLALAWQQDLYYQIDVQLDDKENMLHGEVRIKYINHSPDTLSYLMLHLYPNAYSTEASVYNQRQTYHGHTNFYFSEEKDRGYVDSLRFMVDNKRVFYTNYKGDKDVVFITLNDKLLPGDSLQLHTPFRIKIPKIFSRMGRDSLLYLMAQWYPKPAVYDEAGWHPIPYADIGEFYGEFAHFDVRITLPENYQVFSTGYEVDQTRNIGYDYSPHDFQGTVTSSELMKTVHLKQDSVHDFAWCASKYFTVVQDSVQLEDHLVQIRHFYAGENSIKNFDSSIQFSKNVLRFGSEKIGSYPYDKLDLLFANKASYGGMEYPCFATINVSGEEVDMVLYHEVMHNWFYGMLANNERKEPFMDETFTSHMDHILSDKYEDASQQKKIMKYLLNMPYYLYLGKSKYYEVDQHSFEYPESLYAVLIYNYGERMLNVLHESMGDQEFYAMIRKFYARYSFHHTSLQGFKDFIIEEYPQQKWFVEWLENSKQAVDFKLKSFNKRKQVLKLKNKSPLKLPARVELETSDTNFTFWLPPFEADTVLEIPEKYSKIDAVHVNPAMSFPEYRLANNSSRKFPKLALFASKEIYKHQRYVGFLPAINYNLYDGFMLGAAFHNISGNIKPLDYALVPLYGFRSQMPIGAAALHKNIPIWNRSFLKNIDLLFVANTYHEQVTNNTFSGKNLYRRYIHLSPQIKLQLDNHSMDDKRNKSINLAFHHISRDRWSARYRMSDSSIYLDKDGYHAKNYLIAGYSMENTRLYNPYGFEITTHLNPNFAKFLVSTRLKINYNYKLKGIHFRLFGGYMLHNDEVNGEELLQLTNDAASDYTYSQYMMARTANDGILSNQYFTREGGFRSPTPAYARPLGSSDEWMFTLNTVVDLPSRKIPIALYLDLGSFTKASERLNNSNRFIFNSGFSLYNKYFSLNLPLFYSTDYKDYYTYFLGGKWYNRMSFSIKLSIDDVFHLDRLL